MSEDVLDVSGSLLINLTGWVKLGQPPRDITVGDVRRWLQAVDQYKISDDHVLEDCVLSLFLPSLDVVPIDCGEHTASEHRDALVVLHECS